MTYFTQMMQKAGQSDSSGIPECLVLLHKPVKFKMWLTEWPVGSFIVFKGKAVLFSL